MMESLKFFKIAIGLLVLLNLSLLLKDFYLPSQEPSFNNGEGHRPPHGKKGGKHLSDKIAMDLNLDERQNKSYQEYRKLHMKAMRSINKRQGKLLNEYFKSLKNEEKPEKYQEGLLSEIQALDKERIDVTYEHFELIKELCTPEQLEYFPDVLDDAIYVMLSKRHGPPPHHMRH